MRPKPEPARAPVKYYEPHYTPTTLAARKYNGLDARVGYVVPVLPPATGTTVPRKSWWKRLVGK